ncbi:unnamed protein product [Clavelina lepadiformis]|uniref:Major facilitator superfamily (MFS) profile domain-containing protein n=1 Tax=Clavelina lepadiformis TaxID=159417 RepID=A0ABP0G490_CLALP
MSIICIPDSEIVCDESRKNLRYNMYIILVGQLLMGSGVTPFYTLGLAYIEDSVSKWSASIYLGIADAASALGPVIGFIAGGVILSDYYVDFDKVSE